MAFIFDLSEQYCLEFVWFLWILSSSSHYYSVVYFVQAFETFVMLNFYRTHISICKVATSLKSDNFMEERNRIRYETLFYCQKLEDGFLSGMSFLRDICTKVLDDFVYGKSFISLINLITIYKLSGRFMTSLCLLVSGDNARALFIRSKLPLLDLTRIW